MDYEKIWDALTKECKKDSYYQQCLRDVERAEEQYLLVMQQLTPEQQAVIEDYICACETMDNAMTLLAYHMGAGKK